MSILNGPRVAGDGGGISTVLTDSTVKSRISSFYSSESSSSLRQIFDARIATLHSRAALGFKGRNGGITQVHWLRPGGEP